MRILILSREFPPGPGGIGTHAYQLALRLLDLGWQVEVISRQDAADADEIAAFNTAQPFKVRHLRPVESTAGDLIYRMRVVIDAVRTFQPDLILASGRRSVWLAALLAPVLRKPWAAVGHGTEFTLGSSANQRLTALAFSRAAGVICVSQFTRQRMLRSGVRPRAEWVIPNGADDTRYAPVSAETVRAFRAQRGWEGARLLVTVGNVSPRKGQDIVIRALPQVLRVHPNTHYVIVGLPSKQSEYAALAESLGVGDHVHFLGRQPQEEVICAMSAADLFVITSRTTADGDFEGYGIVVVEAAMCGTPSVVSRESGLVEAVEDGSTGIAVAPEDPDDTARGILRLLDDEPLRRTMGEQARARALSEQTWRQRAAEYDRVFRELLRR
ncbi:MAG: glycosyltransferase family 4 protein [Anaerolineae bacterium]|nr:glycosyltransferase family 4 protein [Anaerolineae bacterium]NUQ05128.1 glycosyltransferase family 4 protein [Anaerolineae bacterium]